MAFISYIMNRISGNAFHGKVWGFCLLFLGTPFLFFYQKTEKSDTSSAASRFAVDTRMKQAYPFLAVDFYSDITRINEIISGDPLPIHITERMNRLISSV